MSKILKKTKPNKLFVAKEVILGSLGVLSVGLVLLELLGHLSEQQVDDLAHVDFAVACVFLLDFIVSLVNVKNRGKYLQHNWYFLLAAIPLTDVVTGLLRGLRVLSVLRLVRAGGHLGFGVKESRRGN